MKGFLALFFALSLLTGPNDRIRPGADIPGADGFAYSSGVIYLEKTQ